MADWMIRFERLLLENRLGEAALQFALAQMVNLPAGRFKVQATADLRVPMRDGVMLAADHYAPVGIEQGPTVLIRTPYGRRGPGRSLAETYAHTFATHGYHVLNQDVRGRFDSEGEFVAFVHEADDGYDTLAWLAQQPWCNLRATWACLATRRWRRRCNLPYRPSITMPRIRRRWCCHCWQADGCRVANRQRAACGHCDCASA